MNLGNILPRRHFLKTLSCGFGYTAFAGLATEAARRDRQPSAPQAGHFPARAKRVIFLFMRGGPSQMDLFDYKPELNKNNGKKIGRNELFGSPWRFRQHGQSGLWISDVLPHLAGCADDLCVIRSMQTDSSAHPLAMPQMHTGSFQFTRPSIGSWVLYGLGAENQDLPGFITINPSRVFGGPANFGSAFLPAAYQGARIGWEGQSLKDASFRNIGNTRISRQVQRAQLEMLQAMNSGYDEANVEGVIDAFELGARLQNAAPQVMDLTNESEHTLRMYGVNEKPTDNFARQCLLARRFAEAGVRFIELGHGSWDHHRNLKSALAKNCQEIDQPFSALLTDLKQRGLLEDTLVVWGGEFGRLPELQYETGRGHNAEGFTFLMAGGGTRGGFAHGATDDYGHKAVEDPVHLHDLHATILHQLGLDHEKLTYRYGGRDFRLTDVHGNVVRQIVAG